MILMDLYSIASLGPWPQTIVVYDLVTDAPMLLPFPNPPESLVCYRIDLSEDDMTRIRKGARIKILPDGTTDHSTLRAI